MHALLPLAAFLWLISCSSGAPSTDAPQAQMEEIKGRDLDGPRQAVYRLRVPNDWIRRDPLPDESLIDTTKFLCEFLIRDQSETVRIAIHNFPTNTLEQRIPPAAQIARWQRQFDPLYTNLSSTQPQSFSGYSGLLFTGVGLINGVETIVLGWSLLLGQEHYRTLSNTATQSNAALYKQMRADVSIKATGPRALVEKHQAAIVSFARSFELIDEIPSP